MYSEAEPRTTEIPPANARLWLLLGVFSLIGSGIPALVLVIARTTGAVVGEAFSQLFHKSLVVHVDLSVLVWFLSMAGMIWSLEAAKSRAWLRFPYIEKTALGCMAAGMVFLAVSPLHGAGEAMMSNYIPVIANPVFFVGLALILTGLLLQVANYLLHAPRFERAQGVEVAVSLGAYAGAWMVLLAALCLIGSVMLMPEIITGEQYYDMLFWAGGHVLQFTHTNMVMVAWVMLVSALVPTLRLPVKWAAALMALPALIAAFNVTALLRYDITSAAFREEYTTGMMYMCIAPVALVAWLIAALIKRRTAVKEAWRAHAALLASLIMSVIVFIYGGFLGMLIRGQNVIIPAHYHGSIVGITIAFMGLCYLLLPRFGWRAVAHKRTAIAQPIILGIGQIMHVTGLAMLGGHNIPRKTPGISDSAYHALEGALQVMRLGGALAILGGVMFVVIVLRATRKQPA